MKMVEMRSTTQAKKCKWRNMVVFSRSRVIVACLMGEEGKASLRMRTTEMYANEKNDKRARYGRVYTVWKYAFRCVLRV